MDMIENEWEIGIERSDGRIVTINGEEYLMPDKDAGITHALLLLIDAVRDLR